MSAITEAERLAMSLPVDERARLASRLIASLPDDYVDEGEIREALERSEAMDADPSCRLTIEQLDDMITNRSR